MMVYCNWKNYIFGLSPSCNVSKKHNILKLDLFASGKIMGAPILLVPLERANVNHWT
jgi:hypothetical protein